MAALLPEEAQIHRIAEEKVAPMREEIRRLRNEVQGLKNAIDSISRGMQPSN